METRTETEYRICGERDGYGAWEGSPDTRELPAVQREAEELAKRNKHLRIEKRIVTYTDWEAVPDA